MTLLTDTKLSAADSPSESPRTQQEKLTATWVQLWNGEYERATQIISDDIHVHAALLDGGDSGRIKGPAGFVGWISQIRSAIPDLNFEVQVGPIIDNDYVAIRWKASGTYGGGFPGATAPAGTKIKFYGTDILRTKSGKIVDYWLNADGADLLKQLQAKTN